MRQAAKGVPPKLSAIQAPVREPLEQVGDEIRRIVLSDFDHIEEVNEHLLFMRGKLLRRRLSWCISRRSSTMTRLTILHCAVGSRR